jgi:glycerol dehydrogenase-like iron-containing ADH family enzyme
LRHVSGVGVLMVLHYIDKSEQLESGERTTLQAILVPEQAAEIGEALQKSVKALEMGKSLRSSIKLLKASNSLEPAMAAATA